MASNFVNTHPQFTIFTNGSFAPASDGEIEFFTVGNTGAGNRKNTFNVPNPSTPADPSEINPNPVPLDGFGRTTVPVFLQGAYNTVVRDSVGNQIDTSDNVSGFGGAGLGTIVVTNVTELAALDTNVYKSAYLLGTTTVSDGGQSWWYFSSGSVAADNGTTIIEPDVGSGRWLILQVDVLGLAPKIIQLGVEWKKGLAVTNGTDLEHDIDVAAGSILDRTQTKLLTLGSAFTKRLDATFAVGTTNGGLCNQDDAGAIQADTVYHIHLITKANGDADIIASKPVTDPLTDTVALAAGFVNRRRIMSVITNADSNIQRYFLQNDFVAYDQNYTTTTTAGGTGTVVNGRAPRLQTALLRVRITVDNATNTAQGSMWAKSTNQTNVAVDGDSADASAYVLAEGATTTGASAINTKFVRLDNSAEYRHRSLLIGTTTFIFYQIDCLGFTNDLKIDA